MIYANYGHEDDFKYLESQGVNITGKIVIVRYGKLFRGGKAQNAEKRGAKGLIIYSDPADYAPMGVNKTYPDYRWLSSDGVQRGNIWMVKGDPLTPGYPATGRYSNYFAFHVHTYRLGKFNQAGRYGWLNAFERG